jgi:hypothetical protein
MGTVSTEILDSIDGALSDYATSKDAMRWAPPESQPETEPCPYAGFTVDLNIDVEPFARAFADYAASFARVMSSSFSGFLLAAGEADREHAAALSAMHRDYDRRRRARLRRKRGR